MFERLYSQKQRDAFGRIDPFGVESTDEFQTLRRNRALVSDAALGNLSAGVGRAQYNRRADVARVETLMERRNGFDLSRTDGPTGIFSLGLEDSVKDFQTRSGLKTDGLIFPRGETVSALSGDKARLPREEGHEDGPGLSVPFQPDDKPDVPARKLSGEEEKKPEAADPPKQEDKKEPADTPPKPGKKPEREEDDEHSCADIEFAYEEALATLHSKEMLLEAAKKSLQILKEELSKLQEELAKETNLLTGDKGKARDIGAGLGVAIGGWLGGPLGSSSGLSAGANLGPVFEEIIDSFVPSQKTDSQLRSMIRSIENEIKNLEEKIPQIEAEVESAKELVKEAADALKECRGGE